MFALREHIIEGNVADHRTQRRGRNPQRRLPEVIDLQYTLDRIVDLPINQEVDANRRIVFGDVGLVRHFAHFFAQINRNGSIDPERIQKDVARSLLADTAAEAKHDDPLILRHDANGAGQEPDPDDDDGQKETTDYESRVHVRSSL